MQTAGQAIGPPFNMKAKRMELRERTATKLRVLIVDDHKPHRDALRAILARHANVEVVAEAGDGLEGLARARETLPDVVCMDVSMRGMSGIEATRRLVAVQPGVKVIALSMHSIKEYILEMLKVGAVSYLTKEDVGQHLLPAIRAVLAKQTYFCPLAAVAMSDIGSPRLRRAMR